MKSKALVQSLPIVLQAHLRPKYFHLNKQLYSLKIKCQVVLVVGILRLVSWMESCEHAQPAENSLKFTRGLGQKSHLAYLLQHRLRSYYLASSSTQIVTCRIVGILTLEVGQTLKVQANFKHFIKPRFNAPFPGNL